MCMTMSLALTRGLRRFMSKSVTLASVSLVVGDLGGMLLGEHGEWEAAPAQNMACHLCQERNWPA